MEKPPVPEVESVIIKDGKKFRKAFSGYTIKQFYSHSTPEKGEGPGWDTKRSALEKYGVDEPSQLPDDPHFVLEPVEE